MCHSADDVCSIDDLRDFIHYKLCEKENLLANEFTMTESLLTRQGEHCGMQFTLDGPRSVRLGAIWAADHNIVYFYDARGVRYTKTRLAHRLARPEPQPA